jgi:hypothetical protein
LSLPSLELRPPASTTTLTRTLAPDDGLVLPVMPASIAQKRPSVEKVHALTAILALCARRNSRAQPCRQTSPRRLVYQGQKRTGPRAAPCSSGPCPTQPCTGHRSLASSPPYRGRCTHQAGRRGTRGRSKRAPGGPSSLPLVSGPRRLGHVPGHRPPQPRQALGSYHRTAAHFRPERAHGDSGIVA